MLAGFGAKPFDSIKILIHNQSNKDLVNVRVSLFQCKGHYEVTASPDSSASISSSEMKKLGENDVVTIKYGRIPRLGVTNILPFITYYGIDASRCTVTVEADVDKGAAAKGLSVEKLDRHMTNTLQNKATTERYFDFAWKLLMSGVIIYMFIRFRGRRVKRQQRNRPA